MSERLRELRRWFPSGTAEGEREILEQVFIYVDEFSEVLSPPQGSPYLLIGKKGSGKSAIVEVASRILTQQKVPVIRLVPSDLSSGEIKSEDSAGDLTKRFHNTLMLAIIGKIAEIVPDFATGDEATIYHEAVRLGKVSPDLTGRFARLLPGLAKPLIKVDLTKVFPSLTQVTTQELEKAVERALSGKRIYLFIDDTDQVASPDKPGHLNRIWALILAVRGLASRIPELRAIVTLRAEVWERLRREAASQRDQTDHFLTLQINLSSSIDQISKIISRRMSLAAATLRLSGDIYQIFFEGNSARPPLSDDYRSWSDLILVRSRDRPRDAIQLINLLADHSNKAKLEKITEDGFRAVMPTFSEQRALLFSQEVEVECSPALEILQSFAGSRFEHGGFLMTAEETRNHFRSVLTKHPVRLFGTGLKAENEDSILSLWRFFYASGVVNARVSDLGQREGYRHLDPASDPMLVTKAKWNLLQGMLWEINPVYRDFLILKQREAEANTGLPVRRPPPRRRR